VVEVISLEVEITLFVGDLNKGGVIGKTARILGILELDVAVDSPICGP